jgi:hypothetical protein
MKRRLWVTLAVLIASSAPAPGHDLPPPVRIGSMVSGHIHPALCVSPKGTLVAVYCQHEYRPHLITRSTDGGRTWSTPKPFPHTTDALVYPGSLSALADGRLVHAWNVWFTAAGKSRGTRRTRSAGTTAGPGASRYAWPKMRTPPATVSSGTRSSSCPPRPG